ncbi:hypothetical protein ABZW30_46425 [Kitasatospora sp. NPDC004669]|uniref:hypothetical protein n=1 Tax=Kitasatospora sp. NPDC004669 TaxID=3154555 RepID=UPI0033A0132F
MATVPATACGPGNDDEHDRRPGRLPGLHERRRGGATLDGRALTVETIDSTPIGFDAVKGNPFTAGSGKAYQYACGLWVRLKPLTPGRHELSLRGGAGGFATAADYHLQVGRPSSTGVA